MLKINEQKVTQQNTEFKKCNFYLFNVEEVFQTRQSHPAYHSLFEKTHVIIPVTTGTHWFYVLAERVSRYNWIISYKNSIQGNANESTFEGQACKFNFFLNLF